MPSSISSSKSRAPQSRWIAIWTVTILATMVFVLGSELIWQSNGFLPTQNDTSVLWAIRRGEVNEQDPMQTVFLGDSRTLFSIDLDEWKRQMPGSRPVQLAICGSSFEPVLKNLAEDEKFEGVVVSSAGVYLFRKRLESNYTRPLENIAEYKSLTLSKSLEEKLRIQARARLTLLTPALAPTNIIRALLDKKLPAPPYIRILANRQTKADFSKHQELEKQRETWIRRYNEDNLAKLPPEDADAKIRDVNLSVDKIQARGGRVIFVEFPLSGQVLKGRLENFPRELYWDRWVSSTNAIMIHFMDFPELSRFECPDLSHLDQAEAKEFTKSLARIIKIKLEKEGRRYD